MLTDVGRFVAIAAAFAAISACGSSSGAGGGGASGSGGAGGAGTKVVTLHPKATPLPGEKDCTVVETTGIPEPDFNHIDVCTPITYPSPPSGGDHWPIWAHYAISTTPIPREMYVHNLEHGGVVFSYNCQDACPDVVKALTAAFEKMSDASCAVAPGPKARVVMTPDPKLETPIAVSAWGATYTATCIDPASIESFAKEVYGHGREDLCDDGADPPPCPNPL